VNPATPAGAPKHGESRIATPILALGERHPDSICKQEVTGSIPVGSIAKAPANGLVLVSVQWVWGT
jgi:hypothetical protein